MENKNMNNNTLKTKKDSKIKLVWNRFKNIVCRAKTAISKVTTPVGKFIRKYLFPIARMITSGIIIAIALNVITANFWPELPDTIPTIYEFFNGFLVLGEYLFKVAIGGLASIFNGSFFEFSAMNSEEISAMWNAFWNWANGIKF